MANRVGKYKISKRESALNLTDGGTVQGDLTVDGATTLNGNVAIGDAATDTVGFFGKTAVVRPIVSSSVVVGGGIDNLVLDFASGVSGSQFNELVTQLTNIGIISSSLG
jgi:hypothetical protein